MKIRKQISASRRIVIKVGSAVLTDTHGQINVSHMGSIVEQIAELRSQGRQPVLVSSGSIVVGRQRLMGSSAHGDARVFAAAGQSGLMSLYETMFQAKGIVCAQVLLSHEDLLVSERKDNLQRTVLNLLELGAIPILNENDTLSIRDVGRNLEPLDNDLLASMVAPMVKADCLVILTNVDGVYRRPPQEGVSNEVISVYAVDRPGDVVFKGASKVGRGGMGAKVDACIAAVEAGVKTVAICNGLRQDSLLRVLKGHQVGTLIVSTLAEEDLAGDTKAMALRAKEASRALLRITAEERSDILMELASALRRRKTAILRANRTDVDAATQNGTAAPLLKRLSLTSAKLESVAQGIEQLARAGDPVDRVVERRELSDGLTLERRTVPLGMLLVIFESRPEVLPQVAALALRSGNGLLLKGGKEARESNKVLIRVISEAVEKSTGGRVSGWCVSLVSSREEISKLLALRDEIDLVIPRGSGQLVSSIEENTRIPVMGHAEGICHIFVHEQASYDTALRLVTESKLDYPAACNAVETLLLQASLLNQWGPKLLAELQSAGVELLMGPRAAAQLQMPAAASLREEYGDQRLTLELVDDVEGAIRHINEYGSGHTESIITQDAEAAQLFQKHVDSACVFHNASTRFADGFRFGLGAEVGISTHKIHARGPVGVQGLLSSKWTLKSSDPLGHMIGDCEQTKGGGRNKGYTFKEAKL